MHQKFRCQESEEMWGEKVIPKLKADVWYPDSSKTVGFPHSWAYKAWTQPCWQNQFKRKHQRKTEETQDTLYLKNPMHLEITHPPLNHGCQVSDS